MQYRTREGQRSAADTVTSLGGLYGIATATAVQVPANASKIVGLMVSVATMGQQMQHRPLAFNYKVMDLLQEPKP